MLKPQDAVVQNIHVIIILHVKNHAITQTSNIKPQVFGTTLFTEFTRKPPSQTSIALNAGPSIANSYVSLTIAWNFSLGTEVQ